MQGCSLLPEHVFVTQVKTNSSGLIWFVYLENQERMKVLVLLVSL